MTEGESKRAAALLASYVPGSYKGKSILNKADEVIVGVYGLNPADYDGEKAYVILPGTCLTDDQLLAIIAAYDELSLTFDPYGLNYRNCMRGGCIEATRFFTDEERERYTRLAASIKRGTLKIPALSFADSVDKELVSTYFNGMHEFTLRPYRRMTDEELVWALVCQGVKAENDGIDYDAMESKARELLSPSSTAPSLYP